MKAVKCVRGFNLDSHVLHSSGVWVLGLMDSGDSLFALCPFLLSSYKNRNEENAPPEPPLQEGDKSGRWEEATG